ncbi:MULTISPECIES: class I SAM-dependent methyltransferase [Methanobacterium]|uniref:Class I SAM-dependent methyltransferase n=1 Tax=Methanobacterium veterum TaxID=408577 RepID=A0A9E5DNX5_9EURY|nr:MULTISPECIES: class I SAM-dependent methyltransferase [Methanobacterium]MCZ3367501.1 class I SAM-dependent methyltransferase [Methanobacterium veterum]MCZ3373351.1 class I SAM-dependent methyltransferase [Methanobacterium veterum]
MSIGTFTRRILGPKNFRLIGRTYRRFFVDLSLLVNCIPQLSPKDHLLDIGGGDGDFINHLFNRYHDIDVTMIDIAPSIGNFIEQEFRQKITILPNTSILDYGSRTDRKNIDVILISDVIHHIPPSERRIFFNSLPSITSKNTRILIKDIEPGYFKSFLSYMSDRYLSGDKNVSLISQAEIVKLMNETFPLMNFKETGLFNFNKPNYCLIFEKLSSE